MSIEELIGTLKTKTSSRLKESTSKPTSISSSKSINTDISSDDESNDEGFDKDDQLVFISRKIRNMKDKEKNSILCYECKKPRHFKLECPNLDKSTHKKRYFKPKEKKVLMRTWEDLDDLLSKEEEQEQEDDDDDKEVNLNDLETIQTTYHEILSSSS
ncbi:hypothetical protein AAZX31_08G256800, partial [Glycine max]